MLPLGSGQNGTIPDEGDGSHVTWGWKLCHPVYIRLSLNTPLASTILTRLPFSVSHLRYRLHIIVFPVATALKSFGYEYIAILSLPSPSSVRVCLCLHSDRVAVAYMHQRWTVSRPSLAARVVLALKIERCAGTKDGAEEEDQDWG